MTDSPRPKLGFVVLTYNRPDALHAVLDALAMQCMEDCVVVIADDGSRAENVERMRRDLPKFSCAVRHVWHADVGFTASRARNLGAANAQADYIVFLDGDCVPSPHFVRAHRALQEQQCFVNGSRVLLSETFTQDVLDRKVRLPDVASGDWLRLRMQGSANKLSHLIDWPGAPGRIREHFHWKGIRSCNFGVWYRDFEMVNGFDETFSGWGHEDADLVLRLHHAGLKRKNGWLASEVFHLWHRENSREGEGANHDRVVVRAASAIVRAEQGLAQLSHGNQPMVTELH